jgi:hypothetical protein
MLEIKNEISYTINKITEHLEFLGYKIEKDKEDKELLLAYHDTNNNMWFWDESTKHQYNVSQICFGSGSRVANTRITLEKLRAINLLNRCSQIAYTYLEEDENDVIINFRAVYLGLYKKDVFSRFIVPLWEKNQCVVLTYFFKSTDLILNSLFFCNICLMML